MFLETISLKLGDPSSYYIIIYEYILNIEIENWIINKDKLNLLRLEKYLIKI